MAPNEGDRILAAGVALTLADGRDVRVKYSMRSLKALEDTFGSIEAAHRALLGLLGPAATNRKIVGTIVPWLAAGLLHEGIAEAALWDLVRIEDLGRYLDVVFAGVDEAFPPPASPGKGEGDEPVGASSGDGSTTPPPDASGAATPSSGP